MDPGGKEKRRETNSYSDAYVYNIIILHNIIYNIINNICPILTLIQVITIR